MIVERRRVRVAAPAQAVYRVFTGIGGARAWYFADWTWRLRGALDRMLGGVGLRRGRRHPDTLRIGNALEFWRVEDLQADRSVRLRAEMKLPGRAWLQFEVRDAEDGTSQLEQTAAFTCQAWRIGTACIRFTPESSADWSKRSPAAPKAWKRRRPASAAPKS